MTQPDLPTLLRMLPERAAALAACPRALIWADLYDAWAAERARGLAITPTGPANPIRRLVRQQGRLPYELAPADIQAHVDWMQARGYAASTIYNSLSRISAFYRWCDRRRADPETPPGFDPAAAIPRPETRPFSTQPLLSPAEVQALLGLLARDPTPIGRRDYAFFLARLAMGVPLRVLQRLRWGQLEAGEGPADGGDVSLRLPDPDGRRVPFPAAAWQAVRAYLQAAGRLETIQPGDYVFAPTRRGQSETNDQAGDWDPARFLKVDRILRALRLYGRAAGLPEAKLSVRALRATAIRARLDAGADPAEMQTFLASRSRLRQVRRCMALLPSSSPERQPPPAPASATPCPSDPAPLALAALPNRRIKHLTGKERLQHGFYSAGLPPAEVEAVLLEDTRGLGGELDGLRGLQSGLLDFFLEASAPGRRRGPRELDLAARLADACTLAAARLAALTQAAGELEDSAGPSPWYQEVTTMLAQVLDEIGLPSESQDAGPPEAGPLPAGGLATAAAEVRAVLRRVLVLAEDARQQREPRAYLRLADVYGLGCYRLLRLLQASGSRQSLLEERLRDELFTELGQAFAQMRAEGKGGEAAFPEKEGGAAKPALGGEVPP